MSRLLVLTGVVAASMMLGRAEAVGAATPMVSSHCPQIVSGSVRLHRDLICRDRSGLIVGSDHTSIDLNGHKIVCVAMGLAGSCQGVHEDEFGVIQQDPNPEIGIDTAGFSDVRVFDGVHGATISGFDVGIRIRGPSAGIQVQRLLITGPPEVLEREGSQGILVTDTQCGRGRIEIGGDRVGNEISQHSQGVLVQNAACVHIIGNTMHDNTSEFGGGIGISLEGASDNLIRSNRVFDNGNSAGFDDGGIVLSLSGSALSGSRNNVVTKNRVNNNRGDGIAVKFGAADNTIAENTMLFNSDRITHDAFDAAGYGAPDNHWNKNNVCRTQNEEVPPGVCNPNEG